MSLKTNDITGFKDAATAFVEPKSTDFTTLATKLSEAVTLVST